MQFQFNKAGQNCKAVKPKETIDPAVRFATFCSEQFIDGVDLPTPCRIWTGSISFCIDSELGESMSFRRAAVVLTGKALPKGYFCPKMICRQPKCCALDHMKHAAL